MFSVWGVGFTVWELGGFELVGAMGFCSLSLPFFELLRGEEGSEAYAICRSPVSRAWGLGFREFGDLGIQYLVVFRKNLFNLPNDGEGNGKPNGYQETWKARALTFRAD